MRNGTSSRELKTFIIEKQKSNNQGRTQGELGLKHPLRWIFYKNFVTCAKEINCFRILFAC